MNAVGTANKDNFGKVVLESDRPVLVDFWAQWCGPCRSLNPILDEVAREMGEAATVVKVDVDDQKELAQEYGVRGIPTMIFFKDGEAKKTVVGRQSKEEILEGLRALS